MKYLVLVLTVFSVFLMFGCSSETPTVPENDIGNVEQAQLAPAVALTEAQINQLILTEAAKQVGQPSNNCKEWVRGVVLNATKKSIPATDGTKYQWVPSPIARVIWQRWEPLVIAPQYFTTKFPSYLLPGQVVQIRWRLNYMQGCEHTMILKSISPSSISYYEANAGPVAKVSTMSIDQWHVRADAWTVYQIK